jgi:hypothetical protein
MEDQMNPDTMTSNDTARREHPPTALDPLLVETRRAAEILGFSVSTLEKWRFYETPGSPPVVRVGRACRLSGVSTDGTKSA